MQTNMQYFIVTGDLLTTAIKIEMTKLAISIIIIGGKG